MVFFVRFAVSEMQSLVLLCAAALVTATPILYDGRAPLNLTEADIEASTGPYLRYVQSLALTREKFSFTVVQ